MTYREQCDQYFEYINEIIRNISADVSFIQTIESNELLYKFAIEIDSRAFWYIKNIRAFFEKYPELFYYYSLWENKDPEIVNYVYDNIINAVPYDINQTYDQALKILYHTKSLHYVMFNHRDALFQTALDLNFEDNLQYVSNYYQLDVVLSHIHFLLRNDDTLTIKMIVDNIYHKFKNPHRQMFLAHIAYEYNYEPIIPEYIFMDYNERKKFEQAIHDHMISQINSTPDQQQTLKKFYNTEYLNEERTKYLGSLVPETFHPPNKISVLLLKTLLMNNYKQKLLNEYITNATNSGYIVYQHNGYYDAYYNTIIEDLKNMEPNKNIKLLYLHDVDGYVDDYKLFFNIIKKTFPNLEALIIGVQDDVINVLENTKWINSVKIRISNSESIDLSQYATSDQYREIITYDENISYGNDTFVIPEQFKFLFEID